MSEVLLPNTHVLSVKGNGRILRSLISQIEIINHTTRASVKVRAIWDTGATNSVVSPEVINSLGLATSPTGQIFSDVAGRKKVPTNTYEVDIKLREGFVVELITVSEFSISDHCDCLIGMDIITMGDFTITNFGGDTIMSFCYPSQHKIDYLADANTFNGAMKFHTGSYKGYIAPCFCKSGKAFKNCHGKNLPVVQK